MEESNSVSKIDESDTIEQDKVLLNRSWSFWENYETKTKGLQSYVIEEIYNFDNIISLFRRKGFILIICAYKILNIEHYKDSHPIEEYMNNLIFCGFLTLKNKLKKEVINSIKDLRQFNCNLIISTGDNVFNCLPIAFDSTIIENKNIFAFDKEDKRIVISKIYGLKNENETEDEQDERNATLSLEKTSKQTITNKITSSTQISKLKSLSSRLKKETLRNKD